MKETFTTEKLDLISVTDSLTELMITADLDDLNTILDKEFTLIHITGCSQPKAEGLKEIEAQNMKYFSYHPFKGEVELSIHGNMANVKQQNLLDACI